MSNVLIRHVPGDDLERIRAAAAAQGTSLQCYLREAVLGDCTTRAVGSALLAAESVDCTAAGGVGLRTWRDAFPSAAH